MIFPPFLQFVNNYNTYHHPQSVTVQGHKGQIEDLKKPNLNRKYTSNNAELRPNAKDLQVQHHQGEDQLGLPDLKSQKIGTIELFLKKLVKSNDNCTIF